MKYNEYMESLLEQIQNDRAKILVREEIENHIEDQCEAYECEGIEHEKALEKSVQQMGNPVDVGIELNKIHRARMPIKIILFAIGIMLMGVISQVALYTKEIGCFYESIFSYFYNHGGFIIEIIIIFMLSIAIMLSIIKMDYTFFGRYPFSIYAWYIYAYVFFYIGKGAGITVEPICHILCLCYPLVLAGIMYANRNKNIKGLLTCIICTCFIGIINWSIYEEKFIIIETMIISFIVIFIGIIKNIFNKKKVKLLIILSSTCLLMIIGVSVGIWKGTINLYKPEAHFCECIGIRKSTADKILENQRKKLTEYKLFGEVDIEDTEQYKDDIFNIYNKELILSEVFEKFGIVPGIVAIIILGLFICVVFKLAMRQSNRIGMLLGVACGVSLLIRIVVCILMNLGIGVFYTTVFPILGYGMLNNISTGIFMGIIVCIARNSYILSENNSKIREKWIENFK